jgi:hypothetical protein
MFIQRTRFLLAAALVLGSGPLPAFSHSEKAFPFDDFDDGDLALGSGLLWMPIADDELGGATEARVDTVRPGASGSSGALRLQTTIRPGFAAPFAGVWAPLDREGMLADLSGYRGLRFRARGSGATFLAGFRRGTPTTSTNFLRAFTPTDSWSLVEIDFSELAPQPSARASLVWSPRDVGWLGFTSQAGSAGDLWLEIDDVELVGSAEPPAREPSASGSRVVRTRLAAAPDDAGLEWKLLAEEEEADGRYPSLPDAARLSYAVKGGRLTLRIDLVEPLPAKWLGVNVAIDCDEDPRNGLAWWGFNKEFHFDRLLSAYLTRSGSEYQGVVGITDAKGAEAFDLTRLGSEVLSVAVDSEAKSIFVSVALRNVNVHVGSDGNFHLVATVGSPFIPNDDVPDRGFAAIEQGK